MCGKASYIQGDTTTQRLHFECPANMRIVDYFGFSLRNVSTCSIVFENFERENINYVLDHGRFNTIIGR